MILPRSGPPRKRTPEATAGLSHRDYARLLAFRDGLRRFTRWSEDQARQVGLTPAQHQLLVAVKGHDAVRGPTVGELAAHLGVRQHSAVELTNRAEAGGYVTRRPDPEDGRRVRLALTELGEERLVQLTQLHLSEFRQLAQLLDRLTAGLDD